MGYIVLCIIHTSLKNVNSPYRPAFIWIIRQLNELSSYDIHTWKILNLVSSSDLEAYTLPNFSLKATNSCWTCFGADSPKLADTKRGGNIVKFCFHWFSGNRVVDQWDIFEPLLEEHYSCFVSEQSPLTLENNKELQIYLFSGDWF